MIATVLAGRDEDLGSSLSPLYQQVIERAAAHLYQVFPRLGITSRAALRDALDALDGSGPSAGNSSPDPTEEISNDPR